MKKQRYLLEVAYEGTQYCGWQRQKTGITVQEVIEQVLHKMSNQRIVAHGCSRTDAGVHAKRQLVSFSLPFVLAEKWSVYRLLTSFNSLLPKDIVIQKIAKVASDFLFSMNQGKRYLYTIYNSPVRPLLERNYSWWVPKPLLDIEKMQQSASLLCGEHDFSAFCPVQATLQNPIKKITVSQWKAMPIVEGNKFILRIEGNSFLQHMIRILVGTMYEIGSNKMNVSQLQEAFSHKDRTKIGRTAPGQGLMLDQIFMPKNIEEALSCSILHNS